MDGKLELINPIQTRDKGLTKQQKEADLRGFSQRAYLVHEHVMFCMRMVAVGFNGRR